MSDGPPLVDDEGHAQACHERWSERLNRVQGEPGYKDEWWAEQCLFCRFFVPLVGALVEDWGACTNPASPFDGRVMFEHDGCDQFSEADYMWQQGGGPGAAGRSLRGAAPGRIEDDEQPPPSSPDRT